MNACHLSTILTSFKAFTAASGGNCPNNLSRVYSTIEQGQSFNWLDWLFIFLQTLFYNQSIIIFCSNKLELNEGLSGKFHVEKLAREYFLRILTLVFSCLFFSLLSSSMAMIIKMKMSNKSNLCKGFYPYHHYTHHYHDHMINIIISL